MARTPIPVAGISKTGVAAPTTKAGNAADGNSAGNPDGRTIVRVHNAGVVSRTLNIRITITVDGQPVTPRTVTVPAGQTRLAGPFDRVRYSTTLLLDPEHADLRLSAFRLGPTLLGAGSSGGPFTFSSPAVAADLDFDGLTVDGSTLVVDTVVTSSTLDGSVLVVTV